MVLWYVCTYLELILGLVPIFDQWLFKHPKFFEIFHNLLVKILAKYEAFVHDDSKVFDLVGPFHELAFYSDFLVWVFFGVIAIHTLAFLWMYIHILLFEPFAYIFDILLWLSYNCV